MTKSNEQDERLAEIGRLLDAYGADESRWPVEARGRLEAGRRQQPSEVAGLVAEARAIDALLAAAPAPRSSREAERRLADRIVAAALAGEAAPRPRSTAQVIPLQPSGSARVQHAPARAPVRPNRWRNVAALMAASLLAGIILGGTLRLDPLLEDVADAVGLQSMTTASLLDETGDEDAL